MDPEIVQVHVLIPAEVAPSKCKRKLEVLRKIAALDRAFATFKHMAAVLIIAKEACEETREMIDQAMGEPED